MYFPARRFFHKSSRNEKMMLTSFCLIVLLSGANAYSFRKFIDEHVGRKKDLSSWKGRWFPDKPTAAPEITQGNDDPNSWTGRWFPDKPKPAMPVPSQIYSENGPTSLTNSGPVWSGREVPADHASRGNVVERPEESPDYMLPDIVDTNSFDPVAKHRQEMFTMDNVNCDDGKHNLTLDIPTDESHFLCASTARYIEPNYELPSIVTRYPIPSAFIPSHRCMNETIPYTSPLPTFGPHRAVWAKWGEYDYLPPQRWVHNLEHGGIVMLYNPCAHHFLVNRLKEIVRKCLYKHVITPFKLSTERPFALLAWGWSLTMSDVDLEEAKKFIEDRANHGPETIDTDGKYDLFLKRPASDFSRLGEGICSQV